VSDFLPPVVLKLAADISEYTEKLALASAQLDEFTKGGPAKVAAATENIGAEGRRAGERYAEGLSEHAKDAADKVVQDATTRLRDGRGRFVAAGTVHGAAVATGFFASLRQGLSNIPSGLNDAAKAIGEPLGNVGKVASKGLSILTMSVMPMLMASAAQTAAALAPLVGALGASIPAAVAIAGGAVVTLMVGFHGLTDAAKAAFATGPQAAAALKTAMEGLQPSARAVVMELHKFAPALKDIQKVVQQHMFVGLAEDLDKLGNAWIAPAKAGLAGLSDQFNLLFRGLAQGMSTPAFTGALTTVFSGFTRTFGEFAALAPKVMQAFGNLISAASPFLRMMGAEGSAGFGKFLDWINKLASNGSLQQFFSTAIQLLTPFANLLKDVGSIVQSVFSAMSGAGGPVLGVLGELIHTVAEFFKSAQGGAALQTIFATLAPIMGLLGNVISQVLPIVGKLIVALGPALRPILDAIGPLLQPIIDLIGKFGEYLAPIVGALGPALASVMTALTPLLAMLGGAFAGVLGAMAPIIAQVATLLGQILTQALTALQPLFQALLPPLVQIIQALLPALVPLLTLVGTLFSALMPILTPIINLLAALLAPILRALVPIIGALTPVLTLVANVLTWLITPIANFIAWLVKGLTTAGWWKAVGNWFVDLWHTISNAFSTAVSWVGKKWDEFVGFAKAIPKRIVEAIGNFNDLLVEKGKNLIEGLWHGIQGMGSWLWDKIIGFVKDNIPAPIAKALGIGSPSKVAAALGQWVPIGLAQGMNSTRHHVVESARRLADVMLPGFGRLPMLAGSGGPLFFDRSAPTAPILPGPSSPGAYSGGPSMSLTIPVQIGGKTMETLHVEMIPYAQRYKARTGTTGLA
jgi:phage-related protein